MGAFFAFAALDHHHHTWGKTDLLFLAALALCGLWVVGIVALSTRSLGKLGGGVAGVLCGLLPSALILMWVFVARPGFEESAAGAGVAYALALPSGAGGVVAGILYSGREKTSMTS
jgi:hypothetical protein